MLSLMQVKLEQDAMQQQGMRLLNEVDFVALFNCYGEYRIGGSFRHGLMIKSKPDIDGYIVVEELKLEQAIKLTSELIALPQIRRVAVEKDLPDSLGLQIKTPFENRLWNLDVHFVLPAMLEAFDYLGHVKFDEAQQDAMLLLKANLKAQGLYPGSTKLPGSFTSFDVYSAVLQDNISTVAEMVAWGQNHTTEADEFRANHY